MYRPLSLKDTLSMVRVLTNFLISPAVVLTSLIVARFSCNRQREMFGNVIVIPFVTLCTLAYTRNFIVYYNFLLNVLKGQVTLYLNKSNCFVMKAPVG